MKLLFLSRWYPYPADNGSKIRIFNLLKYLGQHHTVDLISFVSEELAPERLTVMEQLCETVQAVRYKPFRPNSLTSRLALFSPTPRSVIDTYSQPMEIAVDQLYQAGSYDVVIASQVDMVPYALRCTNSPKLLEELELTTQYESVQNETNVLKKLRQRLMWGKRTHYTAKTLSAFKGCTVVSAQEKGLLAQIVPSYQSVAVIPNGVDCKHYQGEFGEADPNRLIYTGALSYQPNLDAMQFFIGQVLPLIQAEFPSVQLKITGKYNEHLASQLPQNEGVTFTGYLEDIRPTLASSWVSVAPLRLGGGTRLKILEALAAGVPVVSTTKGAEGLDLTSEQELIIADTPTEIAEATLRLLNDPDLRQRLSDNGKTAVQNSYDWQIIGQKLNDFMGQVTR